MQVDENCGRLGGTRLLNVALGDDDDNMRDTFELWLEKVRTFLFDRFNFHLFNRFNFI